MERPLVVERVRTASHWLTWMILIPITIWILWSALNKKTESNAYSKGASHEETAIDLAVHEYPLSFGCARLDLRGTPALIKKEKKE